MDVCIPAKCPGCEGMVAAPRGAISEERLESDDRRLRGGPRSGGRLGSGVRSDK